MESVFDTIPGPGPDAFDRVVLDLDALAVEELEPRLEFAGCGCGYSLTATGDMYGWTITQSYYDCGCLT